MNSANLPFIAAIRCAAGLLLGCAMASVPASAQTLFLPSGSSGIGTSSNGNVGIGTASPGNAFEVRGITRISDGTNYGWIFAGSSGGLNAFHIGSFTNVPLAFFTSGSAPRMTIDVSGNVGIGTTAPLSKLEVSGASVGLSATAAYNFISTQDHTAYRGVFLGFDSSGQTGVIGAASGGGQSQLAFWTHNGSSNVEVARFDGNGRLGIGTPTPSADIHLRHATGHSYLRLETGDAANVIQFQRGATIYNSIASPWATPGDLAIFDNVGNVVRLYVATNGNVGIGTTSPSAKLSVDGQIRARELIVTDTGWADHVFAADYRLAPLSEVEQHIQQNGHLPDVPSAAEVAARGVSVGEMQKILLQKIEELTLHQIEQEKRLNTQADRIRVLETENAQLRIR